MKSRYWIRKNGHNNLCIAMFESVLTSYIYKHDDKTVKLEFGENLVLQTLHSVPGLRTLRLTRRASLAVDKMLPNLRNLQVFSYQYNCSDEVIESLAFHCQNLKQLDLYRSTWITNVSVQHLLLLKKLVILDLAETQIDNNHYSLLLSELPIKSIRFSQPHEKILDHLADVKLHNISHVSGFVEDISLLAEKCPNITHMDLDLTTNSHDLSCLAALTTLRVLRIVGGDYATSNLNAVLTGTGLTLADLTLELMVNVNLHDIVTLCQSLSSLSLLECILLPLDPNTPPDPQLPHFRNLTFLHIEQNFYQDLNYNYIQHYMSLKTIRFWSINVFTVDFMEELARSGALANLEEFCVSEFLPGALTMQALLPLMKNCPHLKTIEGLRYCPLLSENFIQEFKRWILAHNLDLQIK
jgi:hypothetical protein